MLRGIWKEGGQSREKKNKVHDSYNYKGKKKLGNE
jgi:hypothetical protein